MLWLLPTLLVLPCILPLEAETCPQYCICDNIRLYVACANKNLTLVPSSIPQYTRKLDLRGNDLKFIPSRNLAAVPYLLHLNLQKCNIERLEEGAFRGLGRLVYLNLGFNHIRFILQESFDGLSSLQYLNLEKNNLEEIMPGAFSQLGFLNFLHLGDNYLVYLPDMLFQGLQQVKWIRLSNNKINIIANEAFLGLANLKRLSLDHNELQFLPTEPLSRLSGLIKLEMGWNPITFVGEEAIQMASLKQLFLNNMVLQDVSFKAFENSPQLSLIDLSNNQIRTIQALAGLEKLNHLNLTGNTLHCDCYLKSFKEWANLLRVKVDLICSGPVHYFGDHLDSLRSKDLKCTSHFDEEDHVLTSMETINQSSCPQGCDCKPDLKHSSCANKGLNEIPKGFPEDTILLDLHGNAFNSVPKRMFLKMKHVTSLHLQNSQIKELRLGALFGMTNLVYLYLSNNQISSINPALFQDTPKIGYLYLDHNRFTRIPKGTFQFLPNLFSLHMQHNSVSLLNDYSMYGAEKLHWIYLTGNNISFVAPFAFRNLQILKKLHLDGNLLTKVPTEALKQTSFIEELKLSRNPIKYIGNSAFLPISQSLQHLHLDGMGLEKISKDGFLGLGQNIKSLYLENNKLQNLPNMKNFINLEVINLANNPFQCDCQLLPLRRWINTLNLKVGAVCAAPNTVKGQKIRHAPFLVCSTGNKGLQA
ncbi:chondroadherin-like protein [Spea bombifrons]|uniref:chondroadherin-like protein n=1 Tax=Spea bombifrons TaxID=233779 RepID=UPI002349D42C|nr:chondroadherin-like protein [Spea bombifrons]